MAKMAKIIKHYNQNSITVEGFYIFSHFSHLATSPIK